MPKYEMREDSGAREIIEAADIEDALAQAREWAADGTYDERVSVTVRVTALDADGDYTGETTSGEVEAGPEPEVPSCAEGEEHDWQSPEWLGGCRENPGVWSEGGTRMRFVAVCANCAMFRTTISTGTQRNPGDLAEYVTYEPANHNSLAWIAKG